MLFKLANISALLRPVAGALDLDVAVVETGGAGERAAELRRRLEALGSVDRQMARHQRLRDGPARHVRRLPGGRRASN